MSEVCEACGAKTVEYRHRLSEPLVKGLAKLEQAGGGPINLKELDLTWSQRDNFQKLRYFGLVLRCRREDGSRRNGVWEITGKGRMFLAGTIGVQHVAVTYRGETIRMEGEQVDATDVIGDLYQQREQWAREAVPHE